MAQFKQYRRAKIAELRRVTKTEIIHGISALKEQGISISETDAFWGSPKHGDMIARDPKNHKDQWLVNKDYFKENFEEI